MATLDSEYNSEFSAYNLIRLNAVDSGVLMHHILFSQEANGRALA